MIDLASAGPLVVVSPHYDDGVFGCGQLLSLHPGSVVITALGGRPAAYGELSHWDKAARFRTGDDIIAIRQEEDRAALRHVNARPVWLDFVESQYAPSPHIEELMTGLEEAILATSLTVVLAPFGLFHSDHKLTHTAVLRIMRRHSDLFWLVYEEPNYRRVANLMEERLMLLHKEGIIAVPCCSSSELGRKEKRRAVQQYRSQLRAFVAPGYPGYDDVFEREWYWTLTAAEKRDGEPPCGNMR